MTVAFIAKGLLNFEEKYGRWRDKFRFLLLRTKRQRFQLIKLSHTTVNPLFAIFFLFLSWNNATLLTTKKMQKYKIFSK